MKLPPHAAIAAALLMTTTPVRAETLEEALTSLVEAERSFARMSAESGYKAAFLGVLAADSTVYQPGPVNGRETVSAGEDPPIVLTWYPVTAGIAASGDLGYTSGPYAVRSKDPAVSRTGAGHYTSVWRRRPGGAWELVVDLGTPHPPEAVAPREWEEPEGDTPLAAAAPPQARATLREALLARDSALGNAGDGEPFLGALAPFAEPEAWIYRPGREPFAGLAAAAVDERTAAEVVRSEPSNAEISVAGDWGYTLGSMTVASGGTTRDAHYLRLWRRVGSDGLWTLFLDTFTPMPAPEAPAQTAE